MMKFRHLSFANTTAVVDSDGGAMTSTSYFIPKGTTVSFSSAPAKAKAARRGPDAKTNELFAKINAHSDRFSAEVLSARLTNVRKHAKVA